MWEPRRLIVLWVSTAGYRNCLIFLMANSSLCLIEHTPWTHMGGRGVGPRILNPCTIKAEVSGRLHFALPPKKQPRKPTG
jgi:hypothetical protein